MASDVGVVIVHYYREGDVVDLVEQLVRNEQINEDSIVLVDNGSHAGLLAAGFESRGLKPRISTQPNVGYGAAVNLGVRHLPRHLKYVLVVTHDVIVHPGAVATLRCVLERDSSLGMAGPMLLRRGTGRVWSLGGTNTRFTARPRHRGAGASSTTVRHAHREGGLIPCDWLDGAFVMLPRSVLDGVGGVSEEYFLYFEDVDLGWKVRRSGYEVACAPNAIAEQSPGGALDQYLATRNMLWMLRRQHRRLAWSVFALENMARLVAGSVAKPQGAATRQRLRFRGFRDGVRQPGRLRA